MKETIEAVCCRNRMNHDSAAVVFQFLTSVFFRSWNQVWETSVDVHVCSAFVFSVWFSEEKQHLSLELAHQHANAAFVLLIGFF